MCASTVFFMNEYCEDVETLRETLQPLLTPSLDLLLLPINDNADRMTAVGLIGTATRDCDKPTLTCYEGLC